ncbi:hypothetical protein DIPPA_02299 [Diplonema papillatum]|nr:hypothetical protein DIPPA_02299 [Diplonema papillatum]
MQDHVIVRSGIAEGVGDLVGAVPPSHVSHPAHKDHMPYNANVPGQVSGVHRIVRSPGKQIGWVIGNDTLEILQLDSNGNAARAGLTPGMRVTAINNVPVTSIEQTKELMAQGTVFEVAVDLPHAISIPIGSTVVIRDMSRPAHVAARLNDQQGVLVQYRSPLIGVVSIPDVGVYDLPVANLVPVRSSPMDGNQKLPPGVAEVTIEDYFVSQPLALPPAPQVRLSSSTRDSYGQDDDPSGNSGLYLHKTISNLRDDVSSTSPLALGLQLEDMVLTSIAAGSPADLAGVEPLMGWKLTHVGGVKVVTSSDVSDTIDRLRMQYFKGEALVLRFEVDEATVRKLRNEPLGIELLGMIVQGVVPGSPAERAGLDKYWGYRLTHVNGTIARSLQDVTDKVLNCDALRLRFEPEEIEVRREPNEQLGMFLEDMFLYHVDPESVCKRYGVGKFIGRRLTHVNKVPVSSLEEIAVAADQGLEPGVLYLRFEVPLDKPSLPVPAVYPEVVPLRKYHVSPEQQASQAVLKTADGRASGTRSGPLDLSRKAISAAGAKPAAGVLNDSRESYYEAAVFSAHDRPPPSLAGTATHAQPTLPLVRKTRSDQGFDDFRRRESARLASSTAADPLFVGYDPKNAAPSADDAAQRISRLEDRLRELEQERENERRARRDRPRDTDSVASTPAWLRGPVQPDPPTPAPTPPVPIAPPKPSGAALPRPHVPISTPSDYVVPSAHEGWRVPTYTSRYKCCVCYGAPDVECADCGAVHYCRTCSARVHQTGARSLHRIVQANVPTPLSAMAPVSTMPQTKYGPRHPVIPQPQTPEVEYAADNGPRPYTDPVFS